MSFPFDLHSAAVSDSHLPCHAHAMLRPLPFFSKPQHSTAVSRRQCCGLEKNGMVGAWHGRGIASVNQTRPHCVNQMEKTHSKPSAAWHGRGIAWARLLCVNRPYYFQSLAVTTSTLHRSDIGVTFPNPSTSRNNQIYLHSVKRTHKRNSTNRSKIKLVVWNSQAGHNSITGEGFSYGHTADFKLPAHAPFRLSLEYERANGLLLPFSFRLATINFDKQCSRNMFFPLVQPHRETRTASTALQKVFHVSG